MQSKVERRKSESRDVEWEVLPPEKAGQPIEPLFRWLAFLMDNLIRIPGTQFRVGLDPLIGLIPGFGDTSSALVSAMALIHAARYGVPKIVLTRMALNILLNELVGIVPGIGDAFSFWFKSNARNYALIQKYKAAANPARKAGRGDWFFVISVLVVLGLIVGLGLVISFFLMREVVHAFARS
jgi:hypothetical protein